MEHNHTFKATVGTCSVAGVKPDNEDAVGFRVAEQRLLNTKGAVAVIADGVSTAEAGKEAAERCVSTVLADYFTTPETWSVKHSIQNILTPLNRKLYNLGHEIKNEARGYITTLSILVLKSHMAHLFHIGDSRIYQLSAETGEFKQLTRRPFSGNFRRAELLDSRHGYGYQPERRLQRGCTQARRYLFPQYRRYS
ncbi:MAG: protein phosphatase 2C domain-containing protein [Porticoccaceae bacterium]